MVGRYILNMGALEMATRQIIARIHDTDGVRIFSADLAARLGYVRKRYPRADRLLHDRPMKTFDVAEKHTGFKNVVVHSPIVIGGNADGTLTILGIVNVTPRSPATDCEIVSLGELKGRVDESAAIAGDVLGMELAYPVKNNTPPPVRP